MTRAPVLREGQHWRVNDQTGCWEWTGSIYRGYARCITGQASREVWRQAGRHISQGIDLHHRCLTRACVNPDHLEPKPRGPHQAEHLRLLTEDDVRMVRALYAAGWTQQAIADEFDRGRSTIDGVLQGRTYGEV